MICVPVSVANSPLKAGRAPLLGRDLRQLGQGLRHALLPLPRRPAPCRLVPPRRRPRIVVHFLLQRLHLRRRIRHTRLQPLAPAKRRGPRARASPDPVLCHPRQLDQPLRHQRRHAGRQQPLQYLHHVLHPDIGQRVMVHRDAPGDPSIRVVLRAQPLDGPGTAHRVQRRVEPQRHQNGRIDRRPPRAPLHRADLSIQGGQIEPSHKLPHDAGPVVGRQQALQVDRPELKLRSVGPLHSRRGAERESSRATSAGASGNRVSVITVLS